MKTKNSYSDRYPSYEKAPKAVIAAVAFSLAMRLRDDNEIDARALLRTEWDSLHKNEIVPQKQPIPHKDSSY